MIKNNRNLIIFVFVLTVVLFSLSFLLAKIDKTNKSYKNLTEHFNKVLLSKEERAKSIIDKISSDNKAKRRINYFESEYYQNLYNEEGISVLVYDKDSLIYWNDNTVEIPDNTIKSINEEKLLLLGNGWYDCIKKDYGQISILSLILIKHEYAYQNEYLDNTFYKDFKISQSVGIQKEKGLYNIYTSDNKFLFSLEFDPKVELSGNRNTL